MAASGAIRRTTSSLFIPTSKHIMKRQDSASKHAHSMTLLHRAGVVRQAASGIYHLLPMGLRAVEKLVRVIDEEMQCIGGAKMLLPSLLTGALWRKTGRWEDMHSELFKLMDRHGTEFCLGPTHEEPLTELVSSEVHSHKQLPLRLYQISMEQEEVALVSTCSATITQVSTKFRDEMRPRYGLLRSREFIMKDMYTFDVDEVSAMVTYELVRKAYQRVFARLELPVVEVKAATGLIGGDLSHELHVVADIGEDTVVSCPECGLAFSGEMKRHFLNEKGVECPQRRTRHMCRLEERNGIEVGHTFYLGTKYSDVFSATFLDEHSEKQICKMGCYGLGVSRILAAVLEHGSAEQPDRIAWPRVIAPYMVCIVPMSSKKDSPLVGRAAALYDSLAAAGLASELVLEDRHHLSQSAKLKDAFLVGYPCVVVVGKEAALEDKYELQQLQCKQVVTQKLTLDELIGEVHVQTS